jgi:hypothetical protein
MRKGLKLMKKLFLALSLIPIRTRVGILSALLTIMLISVPFVSLAAGLVPCGGDGEPRCQLCHLFVMFKNVTDFLLKYIVPSLAVLMLAIGGFMYVFAYLSPSEALAGGAKGGPGLLSQAKRLIVSVIFGLVIIFAAWILVNFFFQMIGVQGWTGLREGWWQIDCPTS